MKACYVSMYYDIKRSGWAQFSRTFDDYLSYFLPYVDLFKKEEEDHMIVYIDDRYITKLQEVTRNSTNICLIPINDAFLEYNIPCWKFLAREREVMSSKFFKAIVGDRIKFPECQYPEYTLINHSKIDFIIYTLNLNLTSAEYICWTDFGFFSRKENIPKRLLDVKRFNPDTINYTLVNPVEDIDKDVYYTLRYAPEKVGGFFFIGKPEVMYQYQQAYHKSLDDYRQKNICDDDQAMALYTYFRNPQLITFNTTEYGWHRVYQANEKKNKKRVISFCLWGDERRYKVGLIENIKLSRKYYPEWEIYVYVHQDSLFPELQNEKNINIIIKQDDYRNNAKKCMLWRLEPILDSTVDVFISRDVDTRIQLREVAAVTEWLNDESKILHVMRDHPQHYNKILGGMYGVRTQSFRNYDWKGLIDTYYRLFGSGENDQHFLEKYLYNMTTKHEKMIHDEIKLYEGDLCRQFPIRYESSRFVGCYVYENDENDYETEVILRNYLLWNLPHRMHNDQVTVAEKLEFIANKLDSIYIIHYTKLTERMEMMMKQLSRLCLDLFFKNKIQWITAFDREDIEIHDADLYSPLIQRNISRGEVANMKAHEYVLRKCRGVSLVIEDDCIFKDNFVDNLHQVLVLLERSEWDMCCLGGPTELNTYPARALDKSVKDNFFLNEIEIFTPTTPAPCTVSSMLYNEKGVSKILSSKYISGFPQCPSDHAIWLANMENNVTMKWAQPFITYEGSKTDMFKTSFTERGF